MQVLIEVLKNWQASALSRTEGLSHAPSAFDLLMLSPHP